MKLLCFFILPPKALLVRINNMYNGIREKGGLMASIKKSVMLNEGTQKHIIERQTNVEWSKAINEGFATLKWLAEQSLLKLTVEEWEIIFIVYTFVSTDFSPPFKIAQDVMGYYKVIDVNQLKDPIKNLVIKLNDMSQVEQFAIIDIAKKYHSKNWSEENLENIIEILKKH